MTTQAVRSWWLVWLLLLMVGAGCGYRLAGSGSLPQGIDRVCITVFDNNSTQTGLEKIFTNQLIYEFSKRGGVSLVDRGVADGILSGAVEQVVTGTVSREGTYTAAERRVWVTLAVRLKTPDKKQIWGDEIKDEAVYPVVSDNQRTQANKEAALRRLSEDMAETVYNRITANF